MTPLSQITHKTKWKGGSSSDFKAKEGSWVEEIPQRWKQPKGEDRMKKEAKLLRCTLDLDHRQRVGPKLAAAHHLPRSVRTKSDRAQAGGANHNQFARVCPEIAVQPARERVEGIEAGLGALAAVVTTDGLEVQVLKDCLSKAKRSAQKRPLVQQISQTESSREGKETLDSPTTKHVRHSCRGKRSSLRTSPCSCSCSPNRSLCRSAEQFRTSSKW